MSARAPIALRDHVRLLDSSRPSVGGVFLAPVPFWKRGFDISVSSLGLVLPVRAGFFKLKQGQAILGGDSLATDRFTGRHQPALPGECVGDDGVEIVQFRRPPQQRADAIGSGHDRHRAAGESTPRSGSRAAAASPRSAPASPRGRAGRGRWSARRGTGSRDRGPAPGRA